MAPEQMTGGIIRESTDIYSFGMTVYEVRNYSST
jgi:serine/threonine protein kinase